jgi:SAM-dependent methyltransferase
MIERALTFGSAASAYERFRPGYPDELVDEVLAYAGGPLHAALEIGAGTGKTTRAFAGHGITVTASEPDPAMLAELRKHVPGTVTTVQAAFEDLPLAAAYDLVFAAASLHWTKAGTSLVADCRDAHARRDIRRLRRPDAPGRPGRRAGRPYRKIAVAGKRRRASS